jgi:hypothetical protein
MYIDIFAHSESTEVVLVRIIATLSSLVHIHCLWLCSLVLSSSCLTWTYFPSLLLFRFIPLYYFVGWIDGVARSVVDKSWSHSCLH